MIMGLGMILMGAGAARFAAGLILLIVTAATAPAKKRKIEKYLQEKY